MKAVVCRHLASPPEVEIRELPEPIPGPCEILVSVRAMGVNYVDVLMAAGLYQHKAEPPFVPGLEAAGEVIAAGERVERFRPGDRVMTAHKPGAFAERVVVAADDAWPMPGGMDFIAAAGFRSAYHTAYHALAQRARLRAGETLLVHGSSGGVGLAAVQVGNTLGATVIGTGGDPDKLRVVQENGAHHVVVASAGVREAVNELAGGRGADVVFDPIGGDLFDETIGCINRGARILIIGFMSGRPAVVPTDHLLLRGASVLGVRAGEACRRNPPLLEESLKTISRWASQGVLQPHVSHVFPMQDVNEAFRCIMERRVVGKAVLTTGQQH